MVFTPAIFAGNPSPKTPVRVMVVDDSAVVRGLMTRWLEAAPGFDVAAVCPNGKVAVDRVKDIDPDVIVLDIEMPVMDGLTALPQLLKASPLSKVVMASTLTRRNASETIKALELGATDYVTKPEATTSLAGNDYQIALLNKISTLGQAVQRRRGQDNLRSKGVQTVTRHQLRPWTPMRPAVIAVGSSTGGPQVLRKVVEDLRTTLPVPMLITQHMPKTFTTILAEHLGKLGPNPCVEAQDGMPVLSGKIYLAPGDYHMRVKKAGAGVIIKLDQSPPVNFCRPAVDPLFESVAEVFGKRTLGVILTGMGHDGLEGARIVTQAGGQILSQDEQTSVVWGMPRAVAEAGLSGAIKPADEIAKSINTILRGEKP